MGKYEGIRRGYIYGLVDPRSGVTRYIGKTLTPEHRLHRHLKEKDEDDHRRKVRWIAQLSRMDLHPTMQILEEGDWISDELDERERYWIAVARQLIGGLLTNLTDGGEGGWEHIKTYKRRSSEELGVERRRINLEKRMKGLDQNGNPVPSGYYPKPFDCKSCGAHVAYPIRYQTRRCQDCRKAETAPVSRKLTEDGVRAIREALSNGAAVREVAAQYGVSYAQISRIKHRVHWGWVD